MVIQLAARDSGLGQGISVLGQALAAGLERRGANYQRQSLIERMMGAQREQKPLGMPTDQNNQEQGILEKTLDQTPLPDPSNPFGIKYTPQQTLAATLLDKDLGNAFIEQNKSVDKRFKEEREQINKYAAPYENITEIQSDFNRLKEAKKLIESKNVALDENIIRNFATALLEDRGSEAVAEFFKTDEQKQLFSLLKPFFKVKEMGGSNPSTREVLLTLSTLPGRLVGRETNLKMINAMIADQASKLEKAKTIKGLRGKGDYSYSEFSKIAEDRALAKFAEEQKNLSRPTAPPPGQGKPLTESVINLIIDEVGTDKAKILQRAQQLGYAIQ